MPAVLALVLVLMAIVLAIKTFIRIFTPTEDKYCPNCEQNVKPKKEKSLLGFIFGLGIFYWLYYEFSKPERCPKCETTELEERGS